MRAFALAALLACALVAGCSDAPADEEPVAASEALSTLHLACMGGEGSIPALESSYLGSCWGHIGHHTYLLPGPRVLQAVNGTLFAVEVDATNVAGEPELAVEASLDGAAWTLVGTIAYPLGQDPSDRYQINFSFETSATPLRLLRIRMPPSQYEGLAGYLDGSDLTATVSPPEAGMALPPLPVRTAGTCGDGVMESFFPSHPCWFGGYDNVDRLAGGDPQLIHVSWDVTDPGWFDSPSFLHTYILGEGAGGALEATARVQMWRLVHYGICSGTDPSNADVLPEVVIQASADGATWTEVARASGPYDQDIALAGDVPDGSRLLRFGTAPGASFDQGGCHHSLAFVVESGYRIT